MTTPNLTALLTKLKELEAKRTPGRWVLTPNRRDVVAFDDGEIVYDRYPYEQTLKNLIYIAQLANTNSTLIQMLETAVGALNIAQIEAEAHPKDVKDSAREALEKIEELAKGVES